MANYYTDIPELKFHLNNPMMKRICELKERNYRDKDEFDYAPLDFEDAVDSYDKVYVAAVAVALGFRSALGMQPCP